MQRCFELVILGGGIAGSALAVVMARAGHDVIIIEKETRFRDRVRGEVIYPWGTAEVVRLGLLEDMKAGSAREILWEIYHTSGVQQAPENFPQISPDGLPALAFPHPEMQEDLLQLAERAGATVYRGAVVGVVEPGASPSVAFDGNGQTHRVRGRLLVGADGRDSRLAHRLGFDPQRDPEHLFISGYQLRGIHEDPPSVHIFLAEGQGLGSVVVETAPGNHRAYLLFHKDALGHRPSGTRDYPLMAQQFQKLAFPEGWLETAEPHGVLASFDGAHRWVDRAHRDGIVLMGDAASCSDPVWGNGLSKCVRDVRLLRDALLADADWDRAADAYAAAHHESFMKLRRLEHLMADLNFSLGAEAVARKRRVEALLLREPELSWRIALHGPDRCPGQADIARILAA